jgi:hypothetical protein
MTAAGTERLSRVADRRRQLATTMRVAAAMPKMILLKIRHGKSSLR